MRVILSLRPARANEALGDLQRCRQIENGRAELGKALAQRDGVGRRAGTDVEQLADFVPIERIGKDLRVAARFDQRIHRIDEGLGFRWVILIHIRRANRLARTGSLPATFPRHSTAKHSNRIMPPRYCGDRLQQIFRRSFAQRKRLTLLVEKFQRDKRVQEQCRRFGFEFKLASDTLRLRQILQSVENGQFHGRLDDARFDMPAGAGHEFGEFHRTVRL